MSDADPQEGSKAQSVVMNRILSPLARPSLAIVPDYTPTKSHQWVSHVLLICADWFLILCGFALAYWMRYLADWPGPLKFIVSEVATQNFVTFDAFLPVTILLIVVLTLLFETKGLYRLPRGAGFIDYFGIILSSTITGIALLIVLVFLYRPFYYSRLIFAFAGVNIIVLLLLWRGILLAARRWGWAHGIGQERVLVVGGNGLGKQVMEGLGAHPDLGYHLVGCLQDTEPKEADKKHFTKLGSVDDIRRVVLAYNIHHVILALPFWEHGRLPQLVQTCRSLGIEFRIAPDLYELSFDRVDVSHVSGVPLIGLKELSIKGWNLALKRAIDIFAVVLSLPLLLPFSLLIAFLIRLDSEGPALFRQQRVGKGGEIFTCYKFRTMVADAERRRAELAAMNEADGPLFKIRRDPRVTRVGQWLRRSSLDELPQLWNVLRGEMSLVGPRPALPEEVEQYKPWHRRRLEVMPGLTGLWQVLGRSDTSFDEMVRLDIYYAEHWTVGMDLYILLKTVPVVLIGRGAY